MKIDKVLHGEVLEPERPVFLQRNPFTGAEPVRIELSQGATIRDYVVIATASLPAAYQPHLEVMIGEHVIPRSLWARVKPKAGAAITVRVRPAGKTGKNILRAVIMIAVVVAATYFLGPQVGAALFGKMSAAAAAAVTAAVTAVVSYGAMLALNALIPPPGLTGDSSKSRPTLQGSSNRFQPYGPIPRVFGETRVFPVLAAHPYTEIVGKKQYLRLLLCAGWGPLDISDIRIGNTPITAFEGVDYEVTQGGPTGWGGNVPITLYNQQVREDSFSTELTQSSSVTRTTYANTTEISVDIAFPLGLVTYTKKGEKVTRTVNFTVRYRQETSPGVYGAWQSPTWLNAADPETGGAGALSASDRAQEATAITGRWKVSTPGTYQVEVTRTTAAGVQQPEGQNQIDKSYWTAMRSVVDAEPVNQDGICLIAVRMKASDQLNGVPNQINCLAKAYLPVRNEGTGVWSYALTRNPAWAYADILRRRGPETMIADSRIDLPTIHDWADECAATAPNASEPMWTFDGIIEGGSVFNALRQIAAIGRASYHVKDGKFSVVRDLVQATPIQHITPRNSWGYTGSKAFTDVPDALRVRFLNKNEEYREDEVIVYRDGYTEANAEEYDTLELFGITSPTMAWREGRYHLAVGILRPEEHKVSMDIEALRCSMGDRVQFSHDVIKVGQAWGRVVSLSTSGANTVGFVLDGDVTFESGKTYQLRCRHSNGSTSIRTVTAPGGTPGIYQSVVCTAHTTSTGPQPGDLFMFGETGLESMPCIVRRIEPGDDLTCTLTLVPYNEAIQSSATGTIPAFTSYISSTTSPEFAKPSTPTIALRSDDSVIELLSDGTIVNRLAVDITPGAGGLVPVASWNVQYRETGALAWKATSGGQIPATTTTVFIEPVRLDVPYDVRVQAVSEYGLAGDWVQSLNHTIVGKTIAPEQPTSPSVTASYRANEVRWTNPVRDLDLRYVEVLASQTNDVATAVVVGRTITGLFIHQNLSGGALWYYWLRSVDTSDNAGTPLAAGSATTLTIASFEGIGADSVLHPSEKLIVIRDWADLTNEKAGLNAAATTFGITTENTAYNTAYSDLSTYLTGLSPAWNSTTASTTIVRATWNSKWEAVYTARQALLNAIDSVTSKGLTIVQDRLAITYDTTGALNPSGTVQTVNFTIRQQNTSGNVTVSLFTSDGTQINANTYVSADISGTASGNDKVYAGVPALSITPANFGTAIGSTKGLILRVVRDGITAYANVLKIQDGAAGGVGDDGLSFGLIYLYQRATSAPAVPSGTLTYDFASRSFTGGVYSPWSLTIPAGTDPLYVTTATASGTGATDSILTTDWATPVVLSQNGAAGSAGANAATVFLFRRAPSSPTLPSTTATYTFATGALTGHNNSWTQTVPAGTDPLYVTTATALGTGATDTIASSEWAAPVIMAQDGTPGGSGPAGLNNALVYLFRRATSSPALPSTSSTFTFATGVLTGHNNSWTQTIPSGTDPLYVTVATASANTATDTIASGEWATPVIMAQDGAPGAGGLNAATVTLYQRNFTGVPPAVPSATATYTFSTAVLTGHNNGWTQTIPAETGGPYLFVTTGTAVSTGTTDTIATGEWATPRLFTRDGFDLSSSQLLDAMLYTTPGELMVRWTEHVRGTGATDLSTGTDANIIGGRFVRLGDGASTDQWWMSANDSLPYDPDALYEITIIARDPAAYGAGAYFGVLGRNADKNAYVSSTGTNTATGGIHSVGRAGSSISANYWQSYHGYLRGKASTGTTAESTDPLNPGKAHDNVAHISPFVCVNYGATGSSDIAMVRLRRLTDAPMWRQVGTGLVLLDTTAKQYGTSWGGSIYSTKPSSNSASVSCVVPTATTNAMLGLTTESSPAAGSSLSFGLTFDGTGNIDLIGGSGVAGASTNANITTYAAGDRFEVQWDGINVNWLKNGTQFHTAVPTVALTVVRGKANFAQNHSLNTLEFAGNGLAGEPGEDGADALSLSASPAVHAVPCDNGGTPKAAIPGFAMTAFMGTSNVTASASYSHTSSGLSGVTHTGGGVYTVSGMTGDTGYVEVTATYNGSSAKERIEYTKVRDAPAYINGSDIIAGPSTSYSQVADVTLVAGPNGTFSASWSYGGLVGGGASTGLDGYMEYSTNGGGAWTAFGTDTPGDDTISGEPVNASGSGTFTPTISQGTSVIIRLMLKRTGTGTVTTSGNKVLFAQWTG